MNSYSPVPIRVFIETQRSGLVEVGHIEADRNDSALDVRTALATLLRGIADEMESPTPIEDEVHDSGS